MRPTETFFDELGSRGYEPVLAHIDGTVRFDIDDGDRIEHWFVTIRKGEIAISRKRGRPDAVISLEKSLADEILSGKTNAIARLLRGQVYIEGDLALIMQLQRVFPRLAGSRELPAAGYATRMS